jgi:hypothetical protein
MKLLLPERESNSDGRVMSYRTSTFAPSAKLIILSRSDLLGFERTSRSKFRLRSTIRRVGATPIQRHSLNISEWRAGFQERPRMVRRREYFPLQSSCKTPRLWVDETIRDQDAEAPTPYRVRAG